MRTYFGILLIAIFFFGGFTAFAQDSHHILVRPGKEEHIHSSLQSTLHLTPGQLKQYAGYTLNMIMNRCSAVDKTKIFQLQKSIGKMIAYRKDKTTEAPILKFDFDFFKSTTTKTAIEKNSVQFQSLVQSMKTCARLPVLPHLDRVATENPFNLIEFGKESNNRKGEESGEVLVQLDFRPMSTKGAELKREEATKKATTAHAPIPVLIQSKAKGNTQTAHTDTFHNDHSRIMDFFKRISSSLSSFFSHALPSSFFRTRRATEDEFNFGLKSQPPKKETGSLVKKGAEKGKEAIIDLFNQICRIYCSTCHGQNGPFFSYGEILDFKMATKELMEYLTSDESFSIMASFILDKDLLESVRSCGRIEPSFYNVEHPVFVMVGHN